MNDTITPPTCDVNLPGAPNPLKGEPRISGIFANGAAVVEKTPSQQYVAIYDEKVVDSDANDTALIERVHAKIGYVPIYVGIVAEVQPVSRIPHYREYRPGGLGP